VSTRRLLVGAVLVIVVLAVVASLVASPDPDGLTKVSEDQGFAHTGTSADGLLSYGPVAGVVGALVVLALAVVVTRLARRRGRGD
jgi:hypothetical protein